jgi:hypothetical protein
LKETTHHGTRAKHSSHKHNGTSKHHAKDRKETAHKGHKAVVLVGKTPAAPKPRKLTPDGLVAMCSARAVAESLRLALGVVASDDDVLELYFRTASDPDEGASILATLHAAATFGLAGRRPATDEPCEGSRTPGNPQAASGSPVHGHVHPECRAGSYPGAAVPPVPLRPGPFPLILGLALPEGDHAVVATPDGWWSWGSLWDPADFPGALVEEAWTVRWAA